MHMLAAVLQAKVAAYTGAHVDAVDEHGCRRARQARSV
jgi:hypothetical protein